MKISLKSIRAFETNALQAFDNEMWNHLQDFAPKVCEIAGETRARNLIKDGIEKAARYGFTNRGSVRFYLELMFTFGCHFDSDPQHFWAQDFLHGDEDDQMCRAKLLFEAYTDIADQTIGQDNLFLIEALKKIELLKPELLIISDGSLHADISEAFKILYPERFSTLGHSTMNKVIDSAIATANSYGARRPSSMLISTGLILFVGHRYDIDPLYHWIGDTLSFESGQDSDKKYILVFKKAQHYIRGAIDFWEKRTMEQEGVR